MGQVKFTFSTDEKQAKVNCRLETDKVIQRRVGQRINSLIRQSDMWAEQKTVEQSGGKLDSLTRSEWR